MPARVALLLSLLLLAPGPARAAPPAAPAQAQADPLKDAFEALPEADRRALQAALVWTGDFNGAVAGTFGPRTREALLAFADRSGAAPEAALTGPVRSKLLVAAEAARGAAGFTLLRDTRAALSIGVPSKRLPVRSPIPDGTRYASGDGRSVLETAGRPASPDGLADVFARLTREAPERHVAYKLARPDFVVVSGEVGDRKFYSRYALATPAGGVPTLRGFTLTYPVAARDMDRIALAVAASFDPMPPMPATPPPAAPAPSAAAPRAPPPPPVLVGAAVLVAPGLALARADAKTCMEPTLAGAPAAFTRQDPESGLALLAAATRPEAVPVVLAPPDAAARLALFFLPGETAPGLAAASVSSTGGGRILAPVQGSDAAVIDDEHRFMGFSGARSGKAVTVGGVVTAATYELIDAARAARFLAAAAVPPGTAGKPLRPPTLLPLRCRARA